MVTALFGIAVLQLAVAAFQRRNRGASVHGSLVLDLQHCLLGREADLDLIIATRGISPSSGGSCW